MVKRKNHFDGQSKEPAETKHFDDDPYRSVEYLGSEQSVYEIVDNSTNVDSFDDQAVNFNKDTDDLDEDYWNS